MQKAPSTASRPGLRRETDLHGFSGDSGRLRWPLLAGILFVAAAGMKVVTLPVALIGLLVVGFLDRRQLVRSLIASLVVGVLFVSATLIWASWEVTWLSDMRSVQPPFWESLPEAWTFLVESAAYWPAIALVPAALILADRTERAVAFVAHDRFGVLDQAATSAEGKPYGVEHAGFVRPADDDHGRGFVGLRSAPR